MSNTQFVRFTTFDVWLYLTVAAVLLASSRLPDEWLYLRYEDQDGFITLISPGVVHTEFVYVALVVLKRRTALMDGTKVGKLLVFSVLLLSAVAYTYIVLTSWSPSEFPMPYDFGQKLASPWCIIIGPAMAFWWFDLPGRWATPRAYLIRSAVEIVVFYPFCGTALAIVLLLIAPLLPSAWTEG